MQPPERLRFEPFVLDVRERTLLRGGEAVPLPPKAFDLLVLLARNAGRLLYKEQLLSEIWPDVVVTEGNLSQTVRQLRRALGEEAGAELIETVPKAGYRFLGVPAAELPTPREAPRDAANEAPASARPVPAALRPGARSRSRWLWLGGFAAVAAVAGLTVPRQTASTDALLRGEPRRAEARRLYLEGRDLLRRMDLATARDRLAEAVAKEPGSALAEAALASAYLALDQPALAAQAAEVASRRTGGLGEEQRLWVEGQALAARRRPREAAKPLSRLFSLYPGELDYGLRLLEAQVEGGLLEEAELSLGRLRQMGAADPRIDLVEARLGEKRSDLQRQAVAAERAIAASEGGPPGSLHAWALGLRGRARLQLGQTAEAREDFEAMARAAEAARDRGAEGQALRGLARVDRRVGAQADGIQRLTRAVALFHELGSTVGEAASRNTLGVLLFDLGRNDESREMYDAALALYREAGDAEGEAGALINLALLAGRLGDRLRSYELLTAALEARRHTADKVFIARSLGNLAMEAIVLGRLSEAERLIAEAEPLTREAGDPDTLSLLLYVRSQVAVEKGELGPACELAAQSAEVMRKSNDPGRFAARQYGHSGTLLAAGRVEEAVATGREAVRLLAEHKRETEEGMARAILAHALAAAGRLAEAEAEIGRARARVPAPQGPFSFAQARLTQAEAELALARRRLADAEGLFAALERSGELGSVPSIALEARLGRARVALAGGRREEARHDAEGVLSAAAELGLTRYADLAERLLAEIGTGP